MCLDLLLQILHPLVSFLESLVELFVDENMILIRVLQVLDLFLEVLHVDTALLNLLIQILHRLFELFGVLISGLPRSMEFR